VLLLRGGDAVAAFSRRVDIHTGKQSALIRQAQIRFVPPPDQCNPMDVH